MGAASQRLMRRSAIRHVAGNAMLVHGQAVPPTCGAGHQWPQQEAAMATIQLAHSLGMVSQA